MVDLTLIQLLMHKHAKHAKHVSHLRSVKTGQCLVAVQKYLFAIWALCWHIFVLPNWWGRSGGCNLFSIIPLLYKKTKQINSLSEPSTQKQRLSEFAGIVWNRI